jgi:exopolysaccharide biosynthesis polyprenyl glycosylphosphotransferase
VFRQYRRWLYFSLILSDVILINLAFAFAYWMRYDLQFLRAVDEANYIPYTEYIPIGLMLTAILIITYQLDGVYRIPRGRSWVDEVYRIISGTTTGIVIVVVVLFFYRPYFYSRLIFIYAGILIVVFLSFSRLVKNIAVVQLREHGVGVRRIMIVGAGEIGRMIMRNLVAHPQLGYQVVGFVDDDPEKGNSEIGRFKGLGSLDNLPGILDSQPDIEEVIITLPWMYHRKILSIIAQCERRNVTARIVPDIFQMSLSRVEIDDLNGIPLIGIREISFSRWGMMLKRVIDAGFSALGLIILSPILVLVAAAIKLDSPGPILFRQVRVGKNGRHFVLHKFRSMRVGAEEEQEKLADLNEATGPLFKIRDDPRLTRVGKFIRRTSLDELPQLYNVLRGEMSLVGPRPPLPKEVEQYQEWHKKRLEIAPGLTGLWQVSGRSELTFDEMVLLDIYYIENWSPILDTTITLRTIPRVLFGDGAY